MWYWTVILVVTFITNKEIHQGIQDEVSGSKERYVFNGLYAVAVILWPLTMMSIVCAWAIKKAEIDIKAKNTHIIMMLLGDNDVPQTNEEWDNFFAENIRRIPRRHLKTMSVVGFKDTWSLSDNKIERIVANELADRDLFGIKR